MGISDYLYYTDCFGNTQEYECYSNTETNKLCRHLFSAGVPEIYSYAYAHVSNCWKWFKGTPQRQDFGDTFVSWETCIDNPPKEFQALQLLKD